MGDFLNSEKDLGIKNLYNGTFANLFATGSLGNKCFWITYQSVGLFSDKMFNDASNNLKYMQFTKFGYKWSDRFATSLGVLYLSNFGKSVILPLLNISYSTEKFVINADLPTKIEVEYLANEKLRFLAVGEFNSGSYYDTDVVNSVKFEKNKISVGVKYNVLKFTWLYVGANKMLDNKYLWQKTETTIGTLKNDYRISMGIHIHFE